MKIRLHIDHVVVETDRPIPSRAVFREELSAEIVRRFAERWTGAMAGDPGRLSAILPSAGEGKGGPSLGTSVGVAIHRAVKGGSER